MAADRAVSDDVVYESRLNAVLFAFDRIPRLGSRCLRRYLQLLTGIREMHTALRRKSAINAASFARQMQRYCELAVLSHPSLMEIGKSPFLLDHLHAAGIDPRAHGLVL